MEIMPVIHWINVLKKRSATNGAHLSKNVGRVSVFCVTRQALRSNTMRLVMCACGTLFALRQPKGEQTMPQMTENLFIHGQRR
jgi:hypothetical protein